MAKAKNRAAGAWLVTGAAGGFGREFARQLSERGQSVALWDRDGHGLEQTRALLGDDARVHLEAVDVTDPAAVLRAAAATQGALGSIAHVIHGAGVLRVGPAAELAPSDYRLMIEVNYLGTVHVTQAVLPHLQQASRGGAGRATLMLVASVAGLRGFPELAGYSASKFAVMGFAQALRDELKDTDVDLRVLCPPPGDTPMVRNLAELPPVYKLSRMFSAEEVVDGALAGLDGDDWILLVDLGSKALWRVGRIAPTLLDLVVRRAQ